MFLSAAHTGCSCGVILVLEPRSGNTLSFSRHLRIGEKDKGCCSLTHSSPNRPVPKQRQACPLTTRYSSPSGGQPASVRSPVSQPAVVSVDTRRSGMVYHS